MKKQSTSRDIQRMAFVESLHESLKKQAEKAIENQNKFLTIASSYVEDGLEDYECIELLMIDGLSKEAAESYLLEAKNRSELLDEDEDGYEYRFQVEDSCGNIWSSYDIGISLYASSDEEARSKVEHILSAQSDFEMERLISVSRIS